MNTNKNLTNIKCPICGYLPTARRAFALHLTKKHHLPALDAEKIVCDCLYGAEFVQAAIEKYKNEEICAYDLYKQGTDLPDIVKLLKLMGLKRTSKEERKTKRYKTKYLEGLQRHYGPGVTNISQVTEVQNKKEQTFAKTWGTYNNYLKNARIKMLAGSSEKLKNPEYIKQRVVKLQKTLKERYGENVTNPSQIPGVGEKISQRQKAKFAEFSDDELRQATKQARARHMEILRSLKTKEEVKQYMGVDKRKDDGKHSAPCSKIEKRIQALLVKEGIKFEHNSNLFKKNWDMIFHEHKLILEVQGDFFHANPKMYSADDIIPILGRCEMPVTQIWERDKLRKQLVESNGWTIRYLWEDEIRHCLTDKTLLELVKKTLPELFIDKNPKHTEAI